MATMRVDIDPFVASSLLDHVKRSNPARGFLLGSMQHDVITVHNFVPMTNFPDFVEKPPAGSEPAKTTDGAEAAEPAPAPVDPAVLQRRMDERRKAQKAAVELFRISKSEKKSTLCTYYPRDLNYVGAYAIGDGKDVTIVERSSGQGASDTEPTTVDVPFEKWAKAPLAEVLGGNQTCLLMSVIVPSRRNGGNEGKISWNGELYPSSKQVTVNIAAESEQTGVVVQTLLDQVSGNSQKAQLHLDDKLFSEPAGSTAVKSVSSLKDTVQKTVQHATAVVAGKEQGNKQLAQEFLGKYDELKKAREAALDGTTPHDVVHDALLVKYTVSLLHSQVVAFQSAAAAASAN